MDHPFFNFTFLSGTVRRNDGRRPKMVQPVEKFFGQALYQAIRTAFCNVAGRSKTRGCAIRFRTTRPVTVAANRTGTPGETDPCQY